jgi:hypothetical protein
MLDSPHTSAPMLKRGNTPPTTRSPPHRSRSAGYPPNRQPATVGEEERGCDVTGSVILSEPFVPVNPLLSISHEGTVTPRYLSLSITDRVTSQGLERHNVEADVDEGGPRAQAATDRAACAAAPHQHQPPPKRQDAVHSAHLESVCCILDLIQ